MGTLDHAFFYNSQNGDRLYDADSFSEWLKKFFTTGVFTGDLQVKEDDGMRVSVTGGYCNIGGKVKMYAQSTPLDVTVAHAKYDRIDTVVIERNDTERDFELKIVTGSATDTPTATPPVREGVIYQLVLAQIYVKAGATKISQANITDKRYDKAVCGLVCATVDEIDFTQIQAQFDAFLRDYKQDVEDSYGEYTDEMDQFEQTAQQDFAAWFDLIKGQLSEDAAGNLQNQIDAEKTARESADSDLQSAIDAEKAARESADSAEKAARESADSAEKAAREKADTALQSAIDTEKAAREKGDKDAINEAVNRLKNAQLVGVNFTFRFKFDTSNGATYANCKYTLKASGTTRSGSFSKRSDSYVTIYETAIPEGSLTAVLTTTYDVTVSGVKESKTITTNIPTTYYGRYYVTVQLTAGFSINGWLASIGKSGSYANLSAVFADEKLTRELMTRHASADYLVKNATSKEVPTFAGNRIAVKWIGLRSYIYNKLMAISAWKTALQASAHKAYIATAPTDNNSEWEFDSANGIDMIYDFGVEVSPLVDYSATTGLFIKNDDNMTGVSKQGYAGRIGVMRDTTATAYKKFIMVYKNLYPHTCFGIAANINVVSKSNLGSTAFSAYPREGGGNLIPISGDLSGDVSAVKNAKTYFHAQNSANFLDGYTETILQMYLKK